MDENIKEKLTSKHKQEIDSDSETVFYRIVPIINTEKDKASKRRIPNEAAFSLREGEKGLSLNWGKYCCQDKTLIVKGLTKPIKEPFDYLNIHNNIVLVLPLTKLNEQGKVEHTPVFHDSLPSPVGKPNNISHSELFPTPGNELEMRLILSDYCRLNYDATACLINFSDLEDQLKILREKLNNTPFHNEWDFTVDHCGEDTV